ncbi:MOP flippase family protein [Actibacterium sp. MT2.3-13A]|uniref:MOP flippase family protein n=1 Tax=Actibacterium sp. MT2.3-13A TaxID=2828332 RepID=UPI001BA7712E|nr:MOP flippase family protein [Actibacterium sp. MT2.3-13A]
MSINRAALIGLSWSALSEVVLTILQIAQIIVLARILAPEEFGLFAITMAVLGVIGIYADLGVNNALVQRQGVTPEQLSSLYWLNIFLGAVLFAGVVLVSQPLAVAFGEERLDEVLIFASVTLVISPFGHQYGILLQKELNFKILSFVETFSAVTSTIVCIVAALAGQGVFSFVWGHLAGDFVTVLILVGRGWRSWRPSLHFRTRDLRGYVGFGLFELGQNTIHALSAELDKVLIGAILGTQALGYYYIALRIATMPLTRMNALFTRVMFPVFANRQTDSKALKYGYLASVRALSSIGYPMFLGTALIAAWLITTIFGDKWENSIIPLQIISVSNVFSVVVIPAQALALAQGQAKLRFIWSMIWAVVRTPTILAGALLGGITGLAVSIFIFSTVMVYPFFRMFIEPTITSRFGQVFKQLMPSLLISSVMCVLLYGAMQFFLEPSMLAVFSIILLGALIYITMHLLFQRRHIDELKRVISGG